MFAHGLQHMAGVAGKGTPHAGKHVGVGVLEGDVQIRQQRPPGFAQEAQEVRRDARGIEIEQAQPGQAVQRQEGLQQGAQVLRRGEVAAPGAAVLRHKHDLPHALGEQGAGLFLQSGGGRGAQAAADGRYGAEGAGMAAAFADLEPGIGGAGG